MPYNKCAESKQSKLQKVIGVQKRLANKGNLSLEEKT